MWWEATGGAAPESGRSRAPANCPQLLAKLSTGVNNMGTPVDRIRSESSVCTGSRIWITPL